MALVNTLENSTLNSLSSTYLGSTFPTTTTTCSSSDLMLSTTPEPLVSPFAINVANWAASSGYLHGLIASLTVIIVSEIGDRTFFIAALLAMKSSRLVVFFASMLALFIMTVVSTAAGAAVNIVPKVYIHYASIALFVVFGLKMLVEAYKMSGDETKEELENVEADLEQQVLPRKVVTKNGTFPQTEIDSTMNPEPDSYITKTKKMFKRLSAFTFTKTFTMVFLAEWGDRSQISTMFLAANENPYAVALGSLIGHALCTGLAVLGGRFVASMISVRTGE